MKYPYTTLILASACLAASALAQNETTNAAAQAESETVSTNAPAQPAAAGGLQIEERTDEERIQLLLDVASVYFEDKDYQSAVDAYERVLEIDPENKEARFIVSHVYISAKQYAKAEKSLIRLVDEYPEDFQIKNNLAWLYATAEDPSVRNGEKAIRLAQEAMVEAPNDHHVWSTLAEAYYVTGQYEKAYRAIQQMAALATKYGRGITKETVAEYNEQILRCKRAWDSEKALNGEDEDSEEAEVSEKPAIPATDGE